MIGGTAVAAYVAIMFLVTTWRDYDEAAGLPREQVTVLAATETDETCGSPWWQIRHRYRRNVYRVELHSASPPDGLPADWVHTSCGAMTVGEEPTVVRVVQEDGSVVLMVNPPSSMGDVLEVPFFALLVGIPFCIIGVAVDRSVERRRASLSHTT